MGIRLGVYQMTSQGSRRLGFLPYKFYGYRDTSTMNSMEYLCKILHKSEDITPQELSDWFCDSPICTVVMSPEEASIFVGLYVADLIRYRTDILPEELLGYFSDIIIALSKMNPDDEIDLCWC